MLGRQQQRGGSYEHALYRRALLRRVRSLQHRHLASAGGVNGLALLALYFSYPGRTSDGRLVSAILAILWAWMGIATNKRRPLLDGCGARCLRAHHISAAQSTPWTPVPRRTYVQPAMSDYDIHPGVLMLAKMPVLRAVVVVPILWAAIGSTAAFTLGVYQDLGLLVAGVLGLVMLLLPRARGIGGVGEGHQPA